jgi:hypothetical protein
MGSNVATEQHIERALKSPVKMVLALSKSHTYWFSGRPRSIQLNEYHTDQTNGGGRGLSVKNHG